MRWEDVIKSFSVEFIKRRSETEAFDARRHSFYVHDPEFQFLSTLLTGYVVDYYYMSAGEVFQLSVPLHRLVLEKDAEFHFDAIKVAREVGAMKDQVILGLLVWSKHPKRQERKEEMARLLATFPPSQIVRKYINTKRNAPNIFGGLGTFEKKLLKRVWEIWEGQGRLEYYFAKYRNYMRQLVNVAHIKVPPEEYEYLKKPIRYQGRSEYLNKIADFLVTKDPDKLPERGVPFELIRSNLPKARWREDILERCDITGNTIVLQAKSLYEAFGDSVLKYVKRAAKSPTVTADKILKALVMASIEGYDPLASELARAYAEKVSKTWQQIKLPLPDEPEVCLVVDASGSMRPSSMRGMFLKSISCVAPFAPVVRHFVLFSEEAGFLDPDLLRTWDGILEVMRIASERYNGGTNIADGLTRAIEVARTGEVNTVILATDEQANIITTECREMDLIRTLLDMGVRVVVINPTPYPVKITDIREKRLTYIPASNPEGVTATLRLIQMKEGLKRAGAKELLQLIQDGLAPE